MTAEEIEEIVKIQLPTARAFGMSEEEVERAVTETVIENAIRDTSTKRANRRIT